jgi:hypothetical protein
MIFCFDSHYKQEKQENYCQDSLDIRRLMLTLTPPRIIRRVRSQVLVLGKPL